MTIEQAITYISNIAELKSNYVEGDEWTESNANDLANLAEAVRTLLGAYKVLQNVDTTATPQFAGLKHLK